MCWPLIVSLCAAQLSPTPTYQHPHGVAQVAGHAYVADTSGGALFQFDIHNGIVAGSGRIIVRGLSMPVGVAVDRQGLVYVSESPYPLHAIDVYRVHGFHATLLRKIVFSSAYEPEHLAVDQRGYLYALINWDAIAWFPPEANGKPDVPHHLLQTNGSGLTEIGTDAAGDLFSVDVVSTIFAYDARPGKHVKEKPSREITMPNQIFANYGDFVTLEGDDLYVGYSGRSCPPGCHWQHVAVVEANSSGPTAPQRIVTLRHGCPEPPPSLSRRNGSRATAGPDYLPDGFTDVVHGGYLYQPCALQMSGHVITGVFTFPAHGNGAVDPLGFAQAPMNSAADIAIGP